MCLLIKLFHSTDMYQAIPMNQDLVYSMNRSERKSRPMELAQFFVSAASSH